MKFVQKQFRIMKNKMLPILDENNHWFPKRLDWIVQCFTSPPTQYRLYGRRRA